MFFVCKLLYDSHILDRFYMLTTYCRDFPKADCRQSLGAYGTRIVEFDALAGAVVNISLPDVVIPNSGCVVGVEA